MDMTRDAEGVTHVSGQDLVDRGTGKGELRGQQCDGQKASERINFSWFMLLTNPPGHAQYALNVWPGH